VFWAVLYDNNQLNLLIVRDRTCPAIRTKRINMDNNLLERITHDPDICHGKPCIRGLRYPVELLLELLSSGMTIEEILADYDDLEQDDIYAALLSKWATSKVPFIKCK